VNKLRLLKKLNDEGFFDCLTGDELHVFLIMIAGSRENGEGEIFPSRIRRVFGRGFSPDRLREICATLEAKGLVAITSFHPGHGSNLNHISVGYRILYTNIN
jgi:hypothetical protein